MKPISPSRATLTVSALFVTGVLLGSWVGRAAVARATDPYAGLDRFAHMLTTIEMDFVEPRHAEHLLDDAVGGMVDGLDPHSRWMTSDEVAALESDAAGRATGFGLELGRDRDGIVVLKVLEGSPAQREGVQRGDQILAIDGERLDGAPIDEVRALFDGDEGEASELEILRDGWSAPQRIEAKRDTVRVPATEHALLDGDIMYVRVVDFQQRAAEEVEEDVASMQTSAKRPWAGLILDLRDNTGGLLSEAVKIADLFIDEGTIVSVRGRRDSRTAHDATPGGFPSDLPVAVLVNGLSASASEIVAGAIRDTERGILVGSSTYGKGSVQQLYRNPDGSALKLTVARYHRPSGAPIEDRAGLEPDVDVSAAHRTVKETLQAELEALEIPDSERIRLIELLGRIDEPEGLPRRRAWRRTPAERGGDPVVSAAIEALTGAARVP